MTTATHLSKIEGYVREVVFPPVSACPSRSLQQKISDYIHKHPLIASAAMRSLKAEVWQVSLATVFCVLVGLAAALAALITIIYQNRQEVMWSDFCDKLEIDLRVLAEGFPEVVDDADLYVERLQKLYKQCKSYLERAKAPRAKVISLQKAWQRVNDCFEAVWQRAKRSQQSLHLFCGCHLAPCGETFLPAWDNVVISGVDRGVIDSAKVAAPLVEGGKPTALLLTTRAGAGNAAISRVVAKALASAWHVQMAPSVTPFEEKAWNALCRGGWWKLSAFFMKGYLARNANFDTQRRMRQGLVDAAVALYEPQAVFLAAPNTVAAALKVTTERKIPLVAVAADFHTDEYALLPEGAEIHLLVPDTVASRAVKGRVREDRIWPIGYPVQDPFYRFAALKQMPAEILRLKASIGSYLGSRLSLEAHEDAITLMMGSLGCGDVIEKYAQQLLKMRFERPLHLFLCCGSNEGLYTTLQSYTNSADVILHPLPRINPEAVAALYTISKSLITKPGGGTLAEAIVMRIPMLLDNTSGHLDAVVWERGNMRFAVDKGIGVEVTTLADVEGLLRPLLHEGYGYPEIAMPRFVEEFGSFMNKLYGMTA